MGNSPSDEPSADDQLGDVQDAPAGLMNSEQEFTHSEIIAPPAAAATGQSVIHLVKFVITSLLLVMLLMKLIVAA